MAASSDIAEIYNKTLITNQLLVTLATVWVWGECTEVSARVLQCVIKTIFFSVLTYSVLFTCTYTSVYNTIHNFMCIMQSVIFLAPILLSIYSCINQCFSPDPLDN